MSAEHNDNLVAAMQRAEPDAHGQAALLLAESILHTLIETGTLTADEASATVQTASEVKEEKAEVAGESKRRMEESLTLLETIGRSLKTDM
jgi:polyhydroxyalkanoate synthesis regulator phasin